jgi:DNA invertase Pin-like site-specific DNA recombinase
MMRIYAAMAQKERELISARTKAALAAAKTPGTVLYGDRGYRPAVGPDAAAASSTRRLDAERAGHRLALELEALRAGGIVNHAGMARALSERRITTPRGSAAWTHTTVARILARIG